MGKDNQEQSHQDYEEVIDAITNTNQKQRDSLLRYAGSKLTDHLVIKALKKAENFLFAERYRYQTVGRSTLLFCGFIIALKDYHYADNTAMHRKCTDDHVTSIDEIHDARMKTAMKRRNKPKKKLKLEPLLPEINTLINANYSLRDIVSWLGVNHNLEISREYLRRVLKCDVSKKP